MSATLDLLKEAANNYGTAAAVTQSMMDCNAPFNVIKAVSANEKDALQNLMDAARQFHDNTFDGAPA